MPRNIQSWVAAAITTLLIMAVPVLGSVSAASAAPGDPIIPTTPSCVIELASGDPATAPPAPTCYDPSGSDMDEFLVPRVNDANGRPIGYENGSWSPYKWDGPNSTGGASQVFVQSTRFDSSAGMYVNGHSWRLTYNIAVTATPEPNAYSVSVGACIGTSDTPLRSVTAFMRNEAGVDGRFIRSVYPAAGGATGGATAGETQVVARLYDGTTVGMPLLIDQHTPGLVPGLYEVTFWLADSGSASDSNNPARWIGTKLQFDVPKCGTGTSTGPGVQTEPRAKIVVLKRGPVFNSVKVVLGSRKATEPTKYKVIRNPRKGPTLRKTYDTKYKVVKYYKVRKGTMIKVRFHTKVLRRRI